MLEAGRCNQPPQVQLQSLESLLAAFQPPASLQPSGGPDAWAPWSFCTRRSFCLECSSPLLIQASVPHAQPGLSPRH